LIVASGYIAHWFGLKFKQTLWLYRYAIDYTTVHLLQMQMAAHRLWTERF
jgi:hypothetical protein